MPREYDTSAEEAGRSIASLLESSRLMPDLADVWRAIGERHARNRMNCGEEESRRGEIAADDPAALAVKANVLVVNAGMRIGLDWQRLLSDRVPTIRRRLDDYRADADPLPEVRNALLDEVGLFLAELAEFASDQARAIQQDMERLQRWLLRDEQPVLPGSGSFPRHRNRLVSDLVEDRLADSTRNVVQALRLDKDITLLRETIAHWYDRADPHIRKMLEHQFDCDAKYFRPLTVFACHKAVSDDPIPFGLIRTAQVVEMFHNVSLIIDDLVDKSPERRGKPTLHTQYNELTAYMVAGYIVADGYDLLARQLVDECRDLCAGRPDPDEAAPAQDDPSEASSFRELYRKAHPPAEPPGANSPDLEWMGPVRLDIRLLSELLKRLAVAECLQWNTRKKELLGLTDWYWLAREDTGCMFEVCACLGSRNQRLRRFGRLLGMLYHGCDDVADLYEEEKSRKGPGLSGGGNEDIRDGILTLPAALAIRNDRIRRLFQAEERDDEQIETLRAAYEAHEIDAHKVLDDLASRAKAEARAHSRAPEHLILLVEKTRELAPRRS